jgi:hypothetical protein
MVSDVRHVLALFFSFFCLHAFRNSEVQACCSRFDPYLGCQVRPASSTSLGGTTRLDKKSNLLPLDKESTWCRGQGVHLVPWTGSPTYCRGQGVQPIAVDRKSNLLPWTGSPTCCRGQEVQPVTVDKESNLFVQPSFQPHNDKRSSHQTAFP